MAAMAPGAMGAMQPAALP